jgi:hypothetical protein
MNPREDALHTDGEQWICTHRERGSIKRGSLAFSKLNSALSARSAPTDSDSVKGNEICGLKFLSEFLSDERKSAESVS